MGGYVRQRPIGVVLAYWGSWHEKRSLVRAIPLRRFSGGHASPIWGRSGVGGARFDPGADRFEAGADRFDLGEGGGFELRENEFELRETGFDLGETGFELGT